MSEGRVPLAFHCPVCEQSAAMLLQGSIGLEVTLSLRRPPSILQSSISKSRDNEWCNFSTSRTSSNRSVHATTILRRVFVSSSICSGYTTSSSWTGGDVLLPGDPVTRRRNAAIVGFCNDCWNVNDGNRNSCARIHVYDTSFNKRSCCRPDSVR
jgi:hypothetical protein